mmetsp:Transcript_1280/g.3547  ORF Transcript_1280/g.3547 Transcript_1280/m.3547 type:complete len:200 (-) Transcript_1280:254-853(-)
MRSAPRPAARSTAPRARKTAAGESRNLQSSNGLRHLDTAHLGANSQLARARSAALQPRAARREVAQSRVARVLPMCCTTSVAGLEQTRGVHCASPSNSVRRRSSSSHFFCASPVSRMLRSFGQLLPQLRTIQQRHTPWRRVSCFVARELQPVLRGRDMVHVNETAALLWCRARSTAQHCGLFARAPMKHTSRNPRDSQH